MTPVELREDQIETIYSTLKKEAEEGGYRFNPDVEFTKNLVRGLLKNEQRYGYRSCPCRLASGKKEEDLDIICPCDYRDPDLDESGNCYCALYVSDAVVKGEKKTEPIPERRPPRSLRKKLHPAPAGMPAVLSSLPLPVWRCRVCGYLCAREQPPEICPICKVSKDRFERFI
jgi:ferredoxin-thioredoxin reductase catalytic subunit/rubredoxin